MQAEGVQIRMFQVGIDLRVDPTRLLHLLGPRTRALYVIHYFGCLQDVRTLKSFTQSNGLALIEDCALALFSEDEHGSGAGTFGDASIFSFRKTLPWCRGGALLGNTAGLQTPPSRSTLSRVLARVAAASGGVKRRLLRLIPSGASGGDSDGDGVLPDMPASYYVDPKDQVLGMDPSLVSRCSDVSFTAERNARRSRWSRWAQALSGASGGAALISALPAGCCPLFFPYLVHDRPAWLSSLRGKGFEIPPWWWGAPRRIDLSAFPDAVGLKQGVLPLPVGSDLSESTFSLLEAEVVGLARAAPRGTIPAALAASLS